MLGADMSTGAGRGTSTKDSAACGIGRAYGLSAVTWGGGICEAEDAGLKAKLTVSETTWTSASSSGSSGAADLAGAWGGSGVCTGCTGTCCGVAA